jgi:ATP-binding cassette subfamily B protein
MLIPRLVGQGVDQAFTLFQEGTHSAAEVQSLLLTSALLIIGVSALRGTFGFLQMYTGESLAQRVVARLRMEFFDRLQSLSFSFYDSVHTGNLMSRGISDIEAVRMFVQSVMVRSFYIAGLVIGSAAFMILMDWQLALISLSFVPFVVIRSAYLRLSLRKRWREIQEKLGQLSTTVLESITGVRVVRAFSAQKQQEKQFEQQSIDVQGMMIDAMRVRASSGSVMSFAFLLAWVAVLWFGGIRVVEGQMTVGQFTQFFVYLTLLQMPIRMMPMLINAIARAHSAGGRIYEVLDESPVIRDSPGAQPLRPTEGRVRFDNVSFSYSNMPVLEDVSFEAGPDHTVGIVGPPGSGKSTIASLLPRFYDTTNGTVSIDGTDVRDATVDSVRRAVGIVMQDPFLFDGTIRENIAYGNPTSSDESIKAAARIAQIDSYIETLPDGYDTEIGERGVTLSGGQRQRMAIARTLLPDPPVVIFDDSTSSVDAGTDRRIREALQAASQGRTTIIIANRLSSLQHANEILVIDRGRVIERGTHTELLAVNGRYRELHELQQQSSVAPSDNGAGPSRAARRPAGAEGSA